MHYYVISIPRCKDRIERLEKRFKHHEIWDQTTIIEGVDMDSSLAEWFHQGKKHHISSLPEHACFLSHIKALRRFVNDPYEEAIIFEDDVMLHKNFRKRLEDILLSKNSSPNLIMLCTLPASWEGTTHVKTLGEENFYLITEKIFGAQAYWISKDYARSCLSRYDKGLSLIAENFVTSELITRRSRGCFVNPPLVVEEGVYSTLRQGQDLNTHRRIFSYYGLENYAIPGEGNIRDIWHPV